MNRNHRDIEDNIQDGQDVDKGNRPDAPAAIAEISLLTPPVQHGVSDLLPSFPVAHILGIEDDPSALMLADANFSHACIRASDDKGLLVAMLPVVCSRLAYFQTVLAHASLIAVPDVGGVLFIGPSGVGKSTQAMMWETFRHAEIINGDKVFLVADDDGETVWGYGSPWRGSSYYRVNGRVKLRAIIDLEQGSRDELRPLNDTEALFSVMSHIFLPHWDGTLTEKAMDTVGKILLHVPVFHLTCLQDRQSVDLVARDALKMEE